MSKMAQAQSPDRQRIVVSPFRGTEGTFMKMIIPVDRRYTENHEWVRAHDDDTLTVGITDHAQHLLGPLIAVEIPSIGMVVSTAEACAVLESVKAASEVYSPVDGVIVDVNAALADNPELINEDPYGEGWIIRVKTTHALDRLLDAAAYQARVMEGGEDEDENNHSLANPRLIH